MTLAEKLKGIFIPGFHKVKWDEVLMRVSVSQECNCFTPWWKSLIRLFYHAIHGYCYSCLFARQSDSSVFYHMNYTGRQSCEKQFESVASLVSGDVLKETKSVEIKVFQFVELIFFLYPRWFFVLGGRNLSFNEKLTVLINLRCLYGLKLFIDTLDLSKYNLFVSFYDSIVSSNYLLHVFKLNGVKSATLQHGAVMRPTTNVIEFSGVEFRSSYSDYLLVWNKEQYELAKSMNISDSKLKIAGIIGFVGAKYEDCIKPSNNTFGVVLSHPSWEAENYVMIRAANILSQATGMKYVLKLHPNYPEDYFDEYINREYYLGNVEKGIPILNYANSVEFSIVGSTSVLNELVYVHHSVIRYSSMDDIYDRYKYLSGGLKFTEPDDITEVRNLMVLQENIFLDEMFEYLCTVDEVTETYRRTLIELSSE